MAGFCGLHCGFKRSDCCKLSPELRRAVPADVTYETGVDEPIHPDFMVASRFIEVGMGNNCDYGCKIYADPRSNVKVLAHNRVYGCDVSKAEIVTEGLFERV